MGLNLHNSQIISFADDMLYFSQQKKKWKFNYVSISWITICKTILNAKDQKSNIHIVKESITTRSLGIAFLWYQIKMHEFILEN